MSPELGHSSELKKNISRQFFVIVKLIDDHFNKEDIDELIDDD